MTKQCELCDLPAGMYCESDQASLCWECDARVHGANFLVARHSRSLLCRSCHTPTPWRASGSWLGPTVSVCEVCMGAGDGGGACDVTEKGEMGGGSGRADGEMDGRRSLLEEEDDEDDDGEDDDGEGQGEEEDEDGENQVVPLSMEAETKTTATAPPVASCSSSDESSSGTVGDCVAHVNQVPENADLSSLHGGEGRSPSQPGPRRSSPSTAAACSSGRMPVQGTGGASSGGWWRPLQDRETAIRRPPALVGSPGRPRRDILPRGGS